MLKKVVNYKSSAYFSEARSLEQLFQVISANTWTVVSWLQFEKVRTVKNWDFIIKKSGLYHISCIVWTYFYDSRGLCGALKYFALLFKNNLLVSCSSRIPKLSNSNFFFLEYEMAQKKIQSFWKVALRKQILSE